MISGLKCCCGLRAVVGSGLVLAQGWYWLRAVGLRAYFPNVVRYMLKWLGVVLVIVLLVAWAVLRYQPSLHSIQTNIAAEFAQVENISSDELLALPDEQLVVFDVRESEEYQVSHIEGAILIPPSLSAEEFMHDYGELLVEKQAVFYCSVGQRSSEYIARLQSIVPNRDYRNLSGGLFNWINEKHSVVGKGVHPYNSYWGRLIEDKTQINRNPMP